MKRPVLSPATGHGACADRETHRDSDRPRSAGNRSVVAYVGYRGPIPAMMVAGAGHVDEWLHLPAVMGTLT